MALAAAATEAPPLEMVAEAAESVTEVPDAGAEKLTTPPSTGSTELFAVTVTLSGLANGVPTSVDWGVLPADRRQREALALEGADVYSADPVLTTLIGGWCRRCSCRHRWPDCRARAEWSASAPRNCPTTPTKGRRRRPCCRSGR